MVASVVSAIATAGSVGAGATAIILVLLTLPTVIPPLMFEAVPIVLVLPPLILALVFKDSSIVLVPPMVARLAGRTRVKLVSVGV